MTTKGHESLSQTKVSFSVYHFVLGQTYLWKDVGNFLEEANIIFNTILSGWIIS